MNKEKSYTKNIKDDSPISLYLPDDLISILETDQKTFKLSTKAELIKRIIENYSPTYAEDKKSIYNLLSDTLNDNFKSNLSADAKNIIYEKLFYMSTGNNKPTKRSSKKKRKLSIRITKNDIELDRITTNNYASDLVPILTTYSKLPQAEREKIVFKTDWAKIENAIRNAQKIKIKLYDKNKPEEVYPYEFVSSGENLYYYLFCENANNENEIMLHRLHTIRHVTLMDHPKDHVFSETVINRFNRMKVNGCQFKINSDYIFEVQFTHDGDNIFYKRYLERPCDVDPSNPLYNNLGYPFKENNDTPDNPYIYRYFDCSYFQLRPYLAPFFEKAKITAIIVPKSKVIKLKTLEEYIPKEGNKVERNEKVEDFISEVNDIILPILVDCDPSKEPLPNIEIPPLSDEEIKALSDEEQKERKKQENKKKAIEAYQKFVTEVIKL